jgi:hypothetical protein
VKHQRRGFRARIGIAAVFAMLALGCKGDGGGPVGPSPVIAGKWSGSAKAGLVQFDATFTGSGGSVGGSGHFTSPIASDDFAVTGSVSGANVNLVLTSSELGATTFIGKFTASDRIVGVLDLGDGDELELTIDRD